MGGHRRCKGTWFSDLPNPELMPRHQWPITSTFNEILTGCGDWNGSRHVGEGIELVVHGLSPSSPKNLHGYLPGFTGSNVIAAGLSDY